MNSILLRDPNITDNQKNKFIDIINKSSKRLLTTINDIIEISKIESGQLELNLTKVKINELLEFNYVFYKQQAEEKGVKLVWEKRIQDERSVVISDKFKLEGIFNNLLNNAVKFTSIGGKIEIGCYLDNEQIVFFVQDSGCGIELTKQDLIFKSFAQADQNLTRAHEGSGLGLSIVKAYIEKMKGKIWLESEIDKGSKFYFSVPYNPI